MRALLLLFEVFHHVSMTVYLYQYIIPVREKHFESDVSYLRPQRHDLDQGSKIDLATQNSAC